MLVRVTERCNMGCSHCFIDAKPSGAHMTLDTYKEVLRFIEWLKMPFILLSGGEPTQHPDIIKMVSLAKKQKVKVILLSNGTFLEKIELKKKIDALNITIQITNDKRYYPKRVPIINSPNYMYTTSIGEITPMHRAKINNIGSGRKSPLCFNLRSILRHYKDFKKSIEQLRQKGKMCTPSINIDGSISAGESNFCPAFGTVDNREALTDNLYRFTCDKCGLVRNLDDRHLCAIGELR